MTEREKRETFRTFSLICQACANTGITAAQRIITLINTAD